MIYIQLEGRKVWHIGATLWLTLCGRETVRKASTMCNYKSKGRICKQCCKAKGKV